MKGTAFRIIIDITHVEGESNAEIPEIEDWLAQKGIMSPNEFEDEVGSDTYRIDDVLIGPRALATRATAVGKTVQVVGYKYQKKHA